MSVVWMALSNELNLAGFTLGYIVSFAILSLVGSRTAKVHPARFPSQLVAVFVYTAILIFEIFISSIDVARRVIDPRLPIDPAIIEVSVQDPQKNSFVAGLSMHAITVTPGEMVVGYNEDTGIMSVHVLNAQKSRQTLEEDQKKRLALIKRIVGRDD